MSLGANILIYRKKKFLTQEDLGNLIGVKKQQVSQYENGINVPSKEILYKIAKVLDCTVADLYSNEAGREPDEVSKLKDKLISAQEKNIQLTEEISRLTKELDLAKKYRQLVEAKPELGKIK